jgi:hypothetical protein
MVRTENASRAIFGLGIPKTELQLYSHDQTPSITTYATVFLVLIRIPLNAVRENAILALLTPRLETLVPGFRKQLT